MFLYIIILVLLQSGKGTEQDINHVESCVLEDARTETSKYSFTANSMDECMFDRNILACEQTLKDVNGKDASTTLLKEEIESALQSIQGLQAEMDKLHRDKGGVWMAEKRHKKSIESLMNQVFVLQSSMNNFEVKFELKIAALDGKLRGVEEIVQESCTSWFHLKQVKHYFCNNLYLKYWKLPMQFSLMLNLHT